MSISSAQIQFVITYQVTPIVLTGGIAQGQPYQRLPIVYITDGKGSIATIDNIDSTDDFFAKYLPLPGGALINTQAATYPFANQTVAANAIIAQPLTISMMMLCPALSFSNRYQTMTTLIQKLTQHNALGGLYDVITPAYTYTSCILTNMHDVTGGDSKQVQIQYQLDFIQPLVTLAAAQTAQSRLMQSIGNGAAGTGTQTLASQADINVGAVDPEVGNINDLLSAPSPSFNLFPGSAE
jgi:hypothetical protein